jgi:LysM repeat protein
MRVIKKLLAIAILALTLFALAAPALAQEGTVVHVVQAGENLYRIALRYGVTVDAVAAANGLSDTRHIHVGQSLIIPTASSPANLPASTSGVHIVQAGENLYRIALRYGLTTNALAAANGIVNASRIYAGQQLTIPGAPSDTPPPAPPPASGQTYTVQRGDTLSSIALRHGVSMWALAQANGIQNPAVIYVGQTLAILGGSASPLPAPPPGVPAEDRWIDVNLSAQQLIAYEGSTPVRSTLVSTGLPGTPTVTGQYRIYVKYTYSDMSGPGYYLPNVPYTMYFYRGYSLHGTYWHSNFGYPMSHGCVNLPTPEAQWLFDWAAVGTLVNVHY